MRRRSRSEKEEEEERDAGLLHLFMLDAGTAAGTDLDRHFLCRIDERLLQFSIQVLEVLWGSLEIQFIPADVLIAVSVFLLPIDSLESGRMVVPVGGAVGMVVDTVAITVLVGVTSMKVEVMGRVVEVIAHRFLRVQLDALALRCGAVLPHLIDEEYFGHVVDDEHLGPVRDRLGLGAAEMNVHDEDGERGGGGDHRHRCDVVFP